VILVAAVVLGLLVLRSAFPENSSVGIVNGSPKPTKTGTPSTTPSVSPSSSVHSSPTPAGKIKGVVVVVLNGTSKAGLAASASQSLQSAGYKVLTPGNAPSTAQTTIYYRSDSRAHAALMKEQFFPFAVVKPAPSSVPDNVQLELILGADFLTASATPTP
jgi:hypothetical protein